MDILNSYSFLAIGKTAESTDSQEFKRYIGIGSSYVMAVNPTKAELDEIRGFESANEPEYIKEGEKGKEAHVTFVLKTDPEVNNGIEFTSLLTFILRPTQAVNRDETKIQVIDKYGNSSWGTKEDVNMKKKLLSSEGKELKIDSDYRIACEGEADLIEFLKKYLRIQDVFDYKNGSWVKKSNPDDYLCSLEHLKDFFKGDFSELKEVLKLQPNNKLKFLYGVRTTDEGKQYQTVASRPEFILSNSAGPNAYAKLEQALTEAKNRGSYPTTEFKVQELAEYTVEATNLDKPAEDSSSSDMPWD